MNLTYAVVAAAVLALLIIAGLGALLGVDVRREDD